MSFMQTADLQRCLKADFKEGENGRQKQDTLFITRTRTLRALQLQLQFTIRGKTSEGKNAVLGKEENGAS